MTTKDEITNKLPPNQIPAGDELDTRAGRAGARYTVERMLSSVHAFGREQLRSLGVEQGEATARRDEVVGVLAKIVADRERGRFVNRSGAVAVLGALGKAQAVPLLEQVLADPEDRETTRGWAAVSLARIQGAGALPKLEAALQHAPPLLRRRLMVALGETGAKEAIPILEQVVVSEAEAGQGATHSALAALHRLEREHQLPLTPGPRRAEKSGGTTEPAP